MDEQELYRKAEKRVKEIKEFYTHAGVYVVINTGLFLINMLTSPGIWWFYWPAVGWGIGLVIHGFTVFGLGAFLGPEWEERKIKELVEKEKSRQKL